MGDERERRVRSLIPEVARTRRKCVYKKKFATACLSFSLYLDGGREVHPMKAYLIRRLHPKDEPF